MRALLGLATLSMGLAYPFMLWLAGMRAAAGLLLAICVLRLGIARLNHERLLLAAGLGLAVAILATPHPLLPRLYPVLVNAGMLAVFALSLLHPPSIIERIARLHEPQLSARGVRYTRCVTQVWCAFFAINGLIALFTALWADLALWTLYNGLIAYLLIGALFAAEYLVRRRIRQRDVEAPATTLGPR